MERKSAENIGPVSADASARDGQTNNKPQTLVDKDKNQVEAISSIRNRPVITRSVGNGER